MFSEACLFILLYFFLNNKQKIIRVISQGNKQTGERKETKIHVDGRNLEGIYSHNNPPSKVPVFPSMPVITYRLLSYKQSTFLHL